MKIYFSGWGDEYRPCGLKQRPCFMLTYFDLGAEQKKSWELLNNYLARKAARPQTKEDVFIDSGAWSLFRLHVLKTGKKAEKKRLTKEDALNVYDMMKGDPTFYSLEKGSVFREYCDKYADFIKAHQDRIDWFANVDAIGDEDLTWDTQRYFEEHHGIKPVPVVHFGKPIKYFDRYLERGYKMIGLGGMARRPDRDKIIDWCDEIFIRACPQPSGKPIVRLHGFAMTTWQLMRRWPWFSVDSTSYLLYGTYGLICVPYTNKKGEFSYHRPPMIVSVSHRGRPVDYKTRTHISQPHKETQSVRKATEAWLEYIGAPKGSVDGKGEMVERGVVSSSEARHEANLRYFVELQNSLPEWPWSLNDSEVRHNVVAYRRHGFGIA